MNFNITYKNYETLFQNSKEKKITGGKKNAKNYIRNYSSRQKKKPSIRFLGESMASQSALGWVSPLCGAEGSVWRSVSMEIASFWPNIEAGLNNKYANILQEKKIKAKYSQTRSANAKCKKCQLFVCSFSSYTHGRRKVHKRILVIRAAQPRPKAQLSCLYAGCLTLKGVK